MQTIYFFCRRVLFAAGGSATISTFFGVSSNFVSMLINNANRSAFFAPLVIVASCVANRVFKPATVNPSI